MGINSKKYSRQKPSSMAYHRYKPYEFGVELPSRSWPNEIIKEAPIWCAVDLRDGNQALIDPMNLDRKLMLFNLLLEIGFKEIEVGFPSASQTDFDFIRHLIDNNLIPDDVTIQVLTQAREHLIKRTYEALNGCKNAIVHFYNSTSRLQRDVVFNKDKKGIIAIASEAAFLCKDLEKLADKNTNILYEYSPESYTGTELDFAIEICDKVSDIINPTEQKPLIINLPATVEMATPNIYADSIEWTSARLKNRQNIILSLHPHNDRGTAVAAAELGLMAGADRVEGCLFGNGERTGNVDLITLALNLFSQGIDPELNLTDIPYIRHIVEKANQLLIPERLPYGGDLVFTAFSGSHQDAIKKGLESLKQTADKSGQNIVSIPWQVPYLPIDPKDIGRDYDAIIRINSQSGKGGIAYILKTEYNLNIPKRMQIEFSKVVQNKTDATSQEILPDEIWRLFENEYLPSNNKNLKWGNLELLGFKTESNLEDNVIIEAKLRHLNDINIYKSSGKGPMDAFINLLKTFGYDLKIHDYTEHALSSGSQAKAASFVELKKEESGQNRYFWGIGIDSDTSIASIKAIISAANRAYRK